MNEPTIYASLEDLKGRLRPETILACLDWNRDSVPDEVAFMSAVAVPTSVDLSLRLAVFVGDAVKDVPPVTLREIALDLYVWRMAIMWPTHMQVDATPLMEKIDDDLRLLNDKYAARSKS